MIIEVPSFSIVIPTYRRHQSLAECLNCLAHYFELSRQDQPCLAVQVIVSDDAGESDLRDFLSQHYPWAIYTKGPGRGPAANRNHGARQASGEWIVFTDDDCLPQPGWIEAYAALADRYDLLEGRTSAIGTRTRVDEECPINETGGYLWSCNFAIKSHYFLALGGFNEDFPAPAMEDVELNVRVNKACLERGFVAAALVFHPWRLRKGYKFARAYASSVAKFVSLHPEAAGLFSVRSLLINSLRSVKRTFLLAASMRCFQGLLRQILLDWYSSFLAWRFVYYNA
jgi:GT2 family glycosyltransferase